VPALRYTSVAAATVLFFIPPLPASRSNSAVMSRFAQRAMAARREVKRRQLQEAMLMRGMTAIDGCRHGLCADRGLIATPWSSLRRNLARQVDMATLW